MSENETFDIDKIILQREVEIPFISYGKSNIVIASIKVEIDLNNKTINVVNDGVDVRCGLGIAVLQKAHLELSDLFHPNSKFILDGILKNKNGKEEHKQFNILEDLF